MNLLRRQAVRFQIPAHPGRATPGQPTPTLSVRAMATCHTTELYRGTALAVADVRCREPASPVGLEGRASGHHVVVARRGVFVRHSAHAGRARRVEHVAAPGQALLYNRDEPYRVSHPHDDGDACTVLWLDDATAVELVGRYEGGRVDPRRPFAIGTAPLSPSVVYRMQALRRALAHGHASTLHSEEEALAIASAAIDAGYVARGRRLRPAMSGASRALRLANDLRVSLTVAPGRRHALNDLAREHGTSPFALARAFRRHHGESIHQYLIHLRVSAALDRLAQGETALSTLALDLGFASHSHFTTTFHRLVGSSPSAVRDGLTRGGMPMGRDAAETRVAPGLRAQRG
jgi:AraC-like DNA-binding protein